MKIQYVQCTDAKEAYFAVKNLLHNDFLGEITDNGVEMDCDDNIYQIAAKGKGSTIYLEFLGDRVEISLKLSFLMRAFKKKIYSTMEEQLAKII